MAVSRKKTTRRRSPARKLSTPAQRMMPEYMPSQPRRFRTSPLLVVLVIVLAFFTGYLFFKVQSLENSGGAAESEALAQAAPSGPVDVEVGHLPVLGDENAPVTVIEFADFQCPFCKSLFDNVSPDLKKDYIDTGKVKFYYRHYPLPFHEHAQKAAEASECANEQSKFWEYHDVVYQNQDEWTPLSTQEGLAKFNSYAGELGLDTASFATCLESGKFADVVKQDLKAGETAGVQGTPTTFVNGVAVDGAQPYSVFKDAIDKALNQ